MGTKIIEKKGLDNDGNEVVVRTIRLEFDGTTLTASSVAVDENGAEVFTPYMVQPWKCNPDGTVSNFTSEQDAFDWAELNLYLF